MKDKHIRVGRKVIGGNNPVLIVAELSGNHLHDFSLAVKTIRAIKKSGADAVKLQTYTPDTLTIDCRNKYFRINQGTLWDGRTLYELYCQAYTPWEWQPKLKKLAEDLGLLFFSTPFDKSSIDFLQKLKVPAYKIASFEISDIPLIEYAASKGKPMIFSTGIAELKDIKEAVNACRRKGNDQIAILKCTSAYPAPLSEANLLTIPDLKNKFKTVVGISDHTLGTGIASACVALGARIIEKHFILDRKLGGPDAAFSLEPDEFKAMVGSIRSTESALGKVTYQLSEKVKKSRVFARSLFVVEDIKKGEKFNEAHIRSIRPGYGLPPKYLKKIIGKRARTNIKRGTPVKWDHLTDSRKDI
jgi:pseudaminic acid synthase